MSRRRKPTRRPARIKISTYRDDLWEERREYLIRTGSTREVNLLRRPRSTTSTN